MDDELSMETATHQLAGKVVIVTGSVGNLGLATAQELQKVGAKTVLVDRSNDRLQENYPDLINSPDHFLAGGVDLAIPIPWRRRCKPPSLGSEESIPWLIPWVAGGEASLLMRRIWGIGIFFSA